MSDTPTNPLAPAQPTFQAPTANHEISSEARDFAMAPVYDGPGKNRLPTEAEQVQRLEQFRGLVGETRMWQERGPAPLTHEQRQEADAMATVGVQPNATPGSYELNLPAGVAPEATDMIRAGMASLEMAPQTGSYFAQRVADIGRRLNQMSEPDRVAFANEQALKLKDWAADKGWNLDEKRQAVQSMLKARNVDDLVAGIMMSDFDLTARLINHAANLARFKRG